MITVGGFKSRLGLGYLRDEDFVGGKRRELLLSSQFSDETLLAYGLPILKVLKLSPRERERIYKIIDQTRIPIETCLIVAEALSRMGYLIVAEKELKGNHLLQLTDKGRKTTE